MATSLRELLAKQFSRYIRVTPSGLEITPGKILPHISAQILLFRPARTLYKNRKPFCRSLDGIQSIKEGRSCASCLLRKNCTPQICLEILYKSVPLRLLLAYTSARNFLCFVSKLREKAQPVENTIVSISVIDRGRWGELCFAIQQHKQT